MIVHAAVELLTDPGLDHPEEVLACWSWLVQGAFRPVAVTRFGDWFIERPTGEIEFLDMLEGDLKVVAPSEKALRTFLATEDGRELLMAEMVELMTEKGFTLKPGECFGYKTPPAMGGEIGSSNIQIYALRVYVALQGQLHQQLRERRG